MALAYEVTVAAGWAVLGPDDRVVVILCGSDAGQAAQDWSNDGYRILPVTI